VKIKAIILDLGGVIAPGPTPEQIAEAANACGVSEPVFLQAFWKNRLAYDAGMDPHEYWRGVAQLLQKTFDDALIAAMIDREIRFWLRMDDRVLAWARKSRAQGMRIGLLSNLPSPLGTTLQRDPDFMAHFDHVTMSFEVGLVKPQSGIYQHSVRALGVEPAEALFVDDRRENVDGALAAGLQAELYTNWESFAASRG
jgi:putative hydrolase of the HAD superfamily